MALEIRAGFGNVKSNGGDFRYGGNLSPTSRKATMEIRTATDQDIDEIERIYATAKQTMRESGNAFQWVDGYPQRSLIEGDIAAGELFLIEDCGRPCAVFMLSMEADPTYRDIDGSWLNDEPYGVIHRVGSDGTAKGILEAALGFAFTRTENVRIDTHRNNSIMRHLLQKAGFAECGTIFCHDGSPRIAYHRCLQPNIEA